MDTQAEKLELKGVERSRGLAQTLIVTHNKDKDFGREIKAKEKAFQFTSSLGQKEAHPACSAAPLSFVGGMVSRTLIPQS